MGSASLLKETTGYARVQGVFDLAGYGTWWLDATDSLALCYFGYAYQPAHDHLFVSLKGEHNLRTAATCIEYATYYKYCVHCGLLSQEYLTDASDGYDDHRYVYLPASGGHAYTETDWHTAWRSVAEEESPQD